MGSGVNMANRFFTNLKQAVMVFGAYFFAIFGTLFLMHHIVGAATDLQPGEVKVSKSAKAVDGKVNTWDIELTLRARDAEKTSDIVLVMDRSGSMGQPGSGGKTKLENAQDAANEFVDTLLPSGNTTNHIALVSFAADSTTDSGFSNDATALKTKINNLNDGGGTYTQIAINRAQALIATSTADTKAIVLLSDGQPTYSTKMFNPDLFLIPYPGFGQQTSALAPQSAYDYANRVGNSQGLHWQYFDGPGTDNDKWYNHGNSTVAEAGFSKNAGSTIYTIALSAGQAGDAVLDAVASPGKAYTASAADLQAIFDAIAGDISAAATDIHIQDVISNSFEIKNTDGIVNGNTVDWNNVPLSSADAEGVRTVTKTIRIELAPGFTEADPATLYPTNNSVAFDYKDADGQPQTKTVASPKVNPVIVHTEKIVNGQKANTNDTFDIAVTDVVSNNLGSSFTGSGTFTTNAARETGTYAISETVTGGGQYDTIYESKLGTNNYQAGSNVSLPDSYQSTTDASSVNNDVYVKVTNTAKRGSLVIEKTLNNCSDPVSVTATGTPFTFEVKNAANVVVKTVTLTVSKDHCHASTTINDLPQGTYTIVEQGATDYTTTYMVDGDNTVHNGKTATVTVGLTSPLARTVVFNNNFNSPLRTITVTKAWSGGIESDHSASFELWRDGAKLAGQPTQTITGNGQASWTVPEFDAYGTPYSYSVKEINVPANYVLSCTGLANDQCPAPENGNVSITNTYVSPKTSVTANKVWVGGPAVHPTVQFQLYRNDVPFDAPKTLPNGTTVVTWNDLDQTDSNGVPYVYTVKEVSVPANYTMTQQGNTITNTYVSPKTSVTANKVWVGGPSEHPTIQFQLYRNGSAYRDPITLPNGTTVVTWNDLDLTDSNGVPYVYTVDEVTVPPNYTKSQNGNTITNTYVSPKINVTANKVWVDGPAEHPPIDLQLTRDGIPQGAPVTLPINGEYTYTWENLDETDANGVKYNYAVNEVAVPENYNATVSVDGLTITNTYVIPTKGQATATKVWVGGPSVHPTIQFQLYRQIPGGTAVAVPNVEIKTLVNGVTSVTWDNLEQTDINGNPYTFSAVEVSVPADYTVSEDGLTITNTYIPPKTTATANKIWVGGPAEHPTIWFKLYRSIGGENAPEAVPGADIQELPNGTTSVSWSDLDQTDDQGNPYIFSVREVNAEGTTSVPANYTVTENGLEVTNTYTSPKTSYTVEKIWKDNFTVHPDVSIQLFRNGIAYGEPIVLQNGVTTYTWEDLDQYDENGVEYVYTVDEPTVPDNYVKYIDGNRITNDYVGKPGMGGGGSPGIGLANIVLPETGMHQNGIFTMLIAAVLTYGIAYFAQPRLQFGKIKSRVVYNSYSDGKVRKTRRVVSQRNNRH